MTEKQISAQTTQMLGVLVQHARFWENMSIAEKTWVIRNTKEAIDVFRSVIWKKYSTMVPSSILRHDEIIHIPALVKPFNFDESFIVDTSSTAKVKIATIDPRIKQLGLDNSISSRDFYNLSCYTLIKDHTTPVDINFVLSTDRYESDFPTIRRLIGLQSKGEKGFLSTKHHNLFFIAGQLVCVYWNVTGWSPFIQNFDHNVAFDEGTRVFAPTKLV